MFNVSCQAFCLFYYLLINLVLEENESEGEDPEISDDDEESDSDEEIDEPNKENDEQNLR